ncbi:hypothetical protein [Pseudomonas mandelii]|uniref:hypothetical protein n=1 Tax=Pseudomonas mandelii TaxID=75612 RepID=UPI00209F0E8D|nr:hypothetical protein [Pseudomonas mandelii]MCO8310849.1 hypothetical protein [Pseudomonas mandelii]
MELHEQLDQVKDANTFLAFAHALAEDKSNGDWEKGDDRSLPRRSYCMGRSQ